MKRLTLAALIAAPFVLCALLAWADAKEHQDDPRIRATDYSRP